MHLFAGDVDLKDTRGIALIKLQTQHLRWEKNL